MLGPAPLSQVKCDVMSLFLCFFESRLYLSSYSIVFIALCDGISTSAFDSPFRVYVVH